MEQMKNDSLVEVVNPLPKMEQNTQPIYVYNPPMIIQTMDRDSPKNDKPRKKDDDDCCCCCCCCICLMPTDNSDRGCCSGDCDDDDGDCC